MNQPEPPEDVSGQSLQKEISQVRRRIGRLLEMYEEGYIEKSTFQQRMESARLRLGRLEEEAKAAAGRADDLNELRLLMGRVEEFAGRVRQGLASSEVETSREIIQALVRRVEIESESVRVVYRVAPSPFDERPDRGVVQYCQPSYDDYTLNVPLMGQTLIWFHFRKDKTQMMADRKTQQRDEANIAVWLLAFTSLGFICNGASGAVRDERTDVRDEIVSIWRGFDGFECRSIETTAPSPADGGSVKRFDFCWSSDGRSALSLVKVKEGDTTYLDVREDGAKRVSVQYFQTPPKAINRVSIDVPKNEPYHYGGLGFAALRLLLPGGRTIGKIIENGGVLTNTGTSNKPRWVLTAKLDEDDYECVLDESHQFLPSTMSVNTAVSRQVLHVSRFEQVDGFWYPAEGSRKFTSHKDQRQTTLDFKVEYIGINRSFSSSKFVWTDFPVGVIVENRLKDSVEAIGGKLARLKLQNLHPPRKYKPPDADPIQVSADPGKSSRRFAETLLVGVAIAAGGLGVYLRRRGF